MKWFGLFKFLITQFLPGNFSVTGFYRTAA